MKRSDHADWITASMLRKESRSLRRVLEATLPPRRVTTVLCTAAAATGEARGLSAMLLHGTRIVACLIAVIEGVSDTHAANHVGDRAGLPRIRILAVAALPGHRHRTPMLLLRLAATRRERLDLASLAIVVDTKGPEGATLAGRDRLWRRLGLVVDLEATGAGAEVTSVVLRPAASHTRDWRAGLPRELRRPQVVADPQGPLTIGVIETRRGWDLLRPHWNDLLATTPGTTALQTFEFQRAWWNHVGWGNALWIVVALRGDRPVAILPMQIEPRYWLAAELKLLSFIGYAPESDRPRLIAGCAGSALAPAIVDYVLSHAEPWAQISLSEQAHDDAFTAAMSAGLSARGYHRWDGEPVECLRVDIDSYSNWSAYLAGRSKALRKALRRKLNRLQTGGRVEFRTATAPSAMDEAFSRYLHVEERSWKTGTTIGIRHHPAIASLYRDLVRQLAPEGGVEFRFLTVGGRDVAATFGIRSCDTYYSLHISHDSQFDECSPGVLLTSMELEQAFRDRDTRVFDFLAGAPANKTTWATSRVVTRDLHAVRPGAIGGLFHFVYFRAKPGFKRLLDRLALLGPWTRAKARILGRHVKDADRDD